MMKTDSSPEALKDLVRRFRVCYEVWPEFDMVEGHKRQIGLALELLGTHARDMEHPEAGCVHCRTVFSALRRIAEHILPSDHRPSRYEIGPYDQAIHQAHVRRDRADVSLTIRIFHREDFEKPLDECQTRCLSEMLRRLRDLGASEVRWRGEKGAEA